MSGMTALDRAEIQNRKNLSIYYREWTQAHRDLQLIRIAMEMCTPDTRAYAEQMIFQKGRATHLLDANQREMSFLQGRDCNEEAITAMLYVIGLQEKVDTLNSHPQPEVIETVRIKVDGEERVVPMTFNVIKQIAAEEVIPYPDYPWYESIPVEGHGHDNKDESITMEERNIRIKRRLVKQLLNVETGEKVWNKRSPDTRPLSAIHDYKVVSKDRTLQSLSIKDLYVNSRERNALMQESTDRIKAEQCYTTSSEILVTGVSELLRWVCKLQTGITARFEKEIENLPEKYRMVLHQLYLEGRNYRELTDSDGKPLSKNSSNRWNKEGLKLIREKIADRLLPVRRQG